MKKLLPLLFLINAPLFSQVVLTSEPVTYTPSYGLQIPSREYRVGTSVKDSTLNADLGKIEFHFSSHTDFLDSIPCTSKVLFTCNGVLDTVDFVSRTKPTRVFKPGKYIFLFYVADNYTEVYTDSVTITAGVKTPLFINFTGVNPIQYEFYGTQEDKPVIYVYSDQPQPVSLALNLQGKMGFTYPSYNKGWNFIADKEGNLFMNGKTYPYLFWEGQTDLDYENIDWQNGSVVQRDSLVPFFEKNLAAMGLSGKEITDYITYWVPKMMKNDSTYIHFLMNDDYEEYASMDITPAPDSKFEVFMLWTAANGMDNSELTPQEFAPFTRKGLTVVEWGGGELSHIPVIFEDFDQ